MNKQTLKIISIEKKTIEYTDKKTGQQKSFDKWNLKLSDGEKETWCDSSMADWNQGWKVGDEVEIYNSQWKSREYKGKTYWNLIAPPPVSRAELEELKQRITKLEEEKKFPNNIPDEPEEDVNPPSTGEYGEVPNEELPF